MGGCQSASDEVGDPRQKDTQNKFTELEKRTFLIPPLKNLDVCTSTGNITDFITNNTQIINKYKKIDVSKHIEDGKYVDRQFDACMKSIGPEPLGQNIQWKRPNQFLKGQITIFQGQIQPRDIKQGKLGDCYLLSALASISQYPFVIKRIFQTTQQSSYGFYGIWLFVDGFWQCVVLDDRFPTHNGKPIFSRNNGNQLWVMLIEKAYAKIFGSYQAIEGGLTGIAMNAITAAPYQYLCKDSKAKPNPNLAWDFIIKHISQNHFLTGSTENNDRNGYLGLVSTHAYTILDAQQVHIATLKGKKKERILKVQNPWGKYEWKGRWSEYSDVWSEELRQQLHFEKADDGIFWINIQDFTQNFGQIATCNYNKNFISTSIKLVFPLDQENAFKGVFLSLGTRSQGYLTLIQKDHRFFGKDSKYQYSLVRLIVLQFDKSSKTFTKYINDVIDCDHDATIQLTLDPGDYYVIVEMDWKASHSRDTVLQYYGQHPVQFTEDYQNIGKEINNIFNEIVFLHQKYTQQQRVYEYAKDPGIKRITGSIAGYVYYHYSNKSKTNNYLCENVVLKERKFIEVYGEKPLKGNELSNPKQQFVVKVYPNEQRIVRLKVSKQGNSFYSFATKIQFYIVQQYSLERLRQLADKKPTKIKTREIQGKPIDVRVKTYNYSGGIVLLYQNKMDKYAYVQEIMFDMDNLFLQNQTMGRNNKLEIELEPQSQKLLSFVVSSPGKQVVFRTKMTFYLNSPEFKF